MTELLPAVRVGFYTEASEWAGAEIMLANLLASLGPQVEATVIGTDSKIVNRLVMERPGAVSIVVQRITSLRDVRGIWTLRAKLKGLDLNIFQANLTWMPSCREALIAAGTIPKLRVVALEHLPLSNPGRRNRIIKQATSILVDAHLAVGQSAARIVEAYAKLPSDSVGTIYNGMPDHGLPSSRPGSQALVVGCLARLDRVKGLDVLLDAIASVQGVRLRVAGEGDQRAPLLAQAATLGIADRVEILDWTDDPSAFLAGIDLFVLPSRAEGLPLSILEAMFSGLAVIATDVGSVSDAVIDGRTGFVVPTDDSNALAAAISRLVEDDGLRSQMGTVGRTRAVEFFSVDRMASQYERLYASLVTSGNAPPNRSEAETVVPVSWVEANGLHRLFLQHRKHRGTESARGALDLSTSSPGE